MTRPEAQATLRAIAASIAEPDAPAAASRLLERLSTRDDADQLRALLLEAGALAVLAPRPEPRS